MLLRLCVPPLFFLLRRLARDNTAAATAGSGGERSRAIADDHARSGSTRVCRAGDIDARTGRASPSILNGSVVCGIPLTKVRASARSDTRIGAIRLSQQGHNGSIRGLRQWTAHAKGYHILQRHQCPLRLG